MQKSILKTAALFALVFILLTYANLSLAQPAHHGKERIQQIKKMKLLDILDLDEATMEKFIAKYTLYEKRIEGKKSQLDSIADEIRFRLNKKSPQEIKKEAEKIKKEAEEIKKLSKKFSDTQNKLVELIKERNKVMEEILDEIEYAKFLIFDNEFTREVQKIIFEKGFKGKKRGNPPDEWE